MNDPNIKLKQQIVDKIKESTNILVTVSRDPSVDDLSAALGLTLMLNKMGKHATAIFSGKIPPAIIFLEPDKVFENTADSLRDFIIALDKEKADHLRYKIEGDVVKIFITPYRTTITSDDLQFSQGDFNVELVLALGVSDQGHLDNALAAHGQILHDVTIATFTDGEKVSELGSIDWHDASASCLCEMVTAISESLKTDKSILDKQISTALLTGIVFATDRFSNQLTTSKLMTMAAQLMAAGADQQLIAAKLNESHEINSTEKITSIKNMSETDGTVDMPVEVEKKLTANVTTEPIKDEPGMLRVSHGDTEPPIEVVKPTKPTEPYQADKKPVDEVVPAVPKLPEPPVTNEIINQLSTLPPSQEIIDDNIKKTSSIGSSSTLTEKPKQEEPLIGGTLNATAEQAAEDNRRAQEETKNKKILTHSYLSGSEPDVGTAINSAMQGSEQTQNVDIFTQGSLAGNQPSPTSASKSAVETREKQINPPADSLSTLAPASGLGQFPSVSNVNDADQARIAVESALGHQLPSQPIAAPVLDLPLPPPLPDFSTLPPPQTDAFDFAAASIAASPSVIANQPSIEDSPSQFHIPGQ